MKVELSRMEKLYLIYLLERDIKYSNEQDLLAKVAIDKDLITKLKN